ncbi:hypothetical protein D477_020248 [Arthrobacter crystallopoietes BAB-32]|uniref:Methyltransferase domain-containing protein n=1 Tax=Arthrobacter crystallopoietes BAB-32 TaxID=1246476 RepID=N1UPW5_9MICC|nr:class I SAM-dependent methyltransferase [Arthrobacter crystallopoietes]EMY32426.1 hypothetical protein D477_020248 [Arthrobacter crystallopoietes BAB-32]
MTRQQYTHGHGHSHAHGHGHSHGEGHGHPAKAEVADLLELDAEVLGPYFDGIAEWAAQQAAAEPRTVVDLGAGTGRGSIALARQFAAAEVFAVDNSPLMLDRIREAAQRGGLDGRIRPVLADLNADWPAIPPADLVWAASSLHEFQDPDRILANAFSALAPNGLMVVIEMDSLTRFLPDDIGPAAPGLEARCHEALAAMGWNSYPDWRPHLERAGFEITAQRSFMAEASHSPSAVRYASLYLGRIRSALKGTLAADDLQTLDRLLDPDSPDALPHLSDLSVRVSRTAWAARRPE